MQESIRKILENAIRAPSGDNYQPWSVQIASFYEQPSEADRQKFLLNFAVLAPSSHNSQPWRFELKENQIGIFLEKSRRLLESDKNDRQAYISLGCAIENLLLAADYYGYIANVRYAQANDYLCAYVELSASQKSKGQKLQEESNHLALFIPKRITNRNPYADKLPQESFLNEIGSLATNDISIYIIADKTKKAQLADIALAASVEAMEDQGFRRELSKYVKPNITSSPIGMPCFGMGIPTPISLIAPTMIRFVNMNKLNREKDELLLKNNTPVFVIIATRDDDKAAWIKAGQVYERIALLATREELSTAMWAAPIQIKDYYKELQTVLQTTFRPQAFFRSGYALKTTPHSPRLAADFFV